MLSSARARFSEVMSREARTASMLAPLFDVSFDLAVPNQFFQPIRIPLDIIDGAQRLSRRGGANQSTLRRIKLVEKHAPAARVQRFVMWPFRQTEQSQGCRRTRSGAVVGNLRL